LLIFIKLFFFLFLNDIFYQNKGYVNFNNAQSFWFYGQELKNKLYAPRIVEKAEFQKLLYSLITNEEENIEIIDQLLFDSQEQKYLCTV
jgi:hypothetical protein